MAKKNKLKIPIEIDYVISAELSYKKHNPLAYDVVSDFMIYGPYGDTNLHSPYFYIFKS